MTPGFERIADYGSEAASHRDVIRQLYEQTGGRAAAGSGGRAEANGGGLRVDVVRRRAKGRVRPSGRAVRVSAGCLPNLAVSSHGIAESVRGARGDGPRPGAAPHLQNARRQASKRKRWHKGSALFQPRPLAKILAVRRQVSSGPLSPYLREDV